MACQNDLFKAKLFCLVFFDNKWRKATLNHHSSKQQSLLSLPSCPHQLQGIPGQGKVHPGGLSSTSLVLMTWKLEVHLSLETNSKWWESAEWALHATCSQKREMVIMMTLPTLLVLVGNSLHARGGVGTLATTALSSPISWIYFREEKLIWREPVRAKIQGYQTPSCT